MELSLDISILNSKMKLSPIFETSIGEEFVIELQYHSEPRHGEVASSYPFLAVLYPQLCARCQFTVS